MMFTPAPPATHLPLTRLPTARFFVVFEAVARTGSVQRAAAELNVTQPAVSQSLRALEDDLGVQLFDRRVRPAAITAAGRILQQGVSEGLGRIARAVDEVRGLAQQNPNMVTIACTLGTATYWLMPRLTGFYDAFPDIAVSVQATAGLPVFLPGVDLVIRYGGGDWRDGASHHLISESVLPVCSPAMAQDHARLDGLARAPLLHVESGEACWLTWPQYLAHIGVTRTDAAAGRRFSNYVQATQAALDGQGVMLGWHSNAADLIRDGRLVPLSPTPYYPAEAFYLVVPHQPPSAASRQFMDWVFSIAGH